MSDPLSLNTIPPSTAPKSQSTASILTVEGVAKQIRQAGQQVLASMPLKLLQVDAMAVAIEKGGEGRVDPLLLHRFLGESGWAGPRSLQVQNYPAGTSTTPAEPAMIYGPAGLMPRPHGHDPVEVRWVMQNHADAERSRYQATWKRDSREHSHYVPYDDPAGLFRAALSSFHEIKPDKVTEDRINELRRLVARHVLGHPDHYADAVASRISTTVPVTITINAKVEKFLVEQEVLDEIRKVPDHVWRAPSDARESQLSAENAKRIHALTKRGISLGTAADWVANPKTKISAGCIDAWLNQDTRLDTGLTDQQRQRQEGVLKYRLLCDTHAARVREEKERSQVSEIEAYLREPDGESSDADTPTPLSQPDPYRSLQWLMEAEPPCWENSEEPLRKEGKSIAAQGEASATFAVPAQPVGLKSRSMAPTFGEPPSPLGEAGSAISAAIELRCQQLEHLRLTMLPNDTQIAQQFLDVESSLGDFAASVRALSQRTDLVQVSQDLVSNENKTVEQLESVYGRTHSGAATLPTKRADTGSLLKRKRE